MLLLYWMNLIYLNDLSVGVEEVSEVPQAQNQPPMRHNPQAARYWMNLIYLNDLNDLSVGVGEVGEAPQAQNQPQNPQAARMARSIQETIGSEPNVVSSATECNLDHLPPYEDT